MKPPCAGQWELFDSLDPADHIEARRLCLTCPMVTACRETLEEASATAYSIAYGPGGTWAGQLVGRHLRSRRQVLDEEAMFTDDEARDAHNAFYRGERNDRIRVGERVYQRRKKRAQKLKLRKDAA